VGPFGVTVMETVLLLDEVLAELPPYKAVSE
jgi:hypothetical protein